MAIIAFGYESGAGKDTCASIASMLLTTSGKHKSVERRGFADGLKDAVYRQFKHCGVHSRQHYDLNRADRLNIIECVGMNVIDLWIAYGTAMRKLNDKVFVSQTLHNLPSVLLISDIRFNVEVEAVKALGGKLVLVKRDGLSKNASDYELDSFHDWDYTIYNNGTFKSLGVVVESLLKEEGLL